ncbi:MAG: family 78 glycoside hydrolase catalytic domain [Halobacteriaceae archaeon]
MSETDGGAPSAPTDLRVEREESPLAVDAEAPRFSWRVESDGRGARQTAYRVVVGRSVEAVAGGAGGVWDSGRVESDRATDVRYGGPELAADETYHWAVRVWDETGARSPWSDPARFGTALGDDGDWAGAWVSHQPGPGDSNGWRSAWRARDADADEEWVQVDLGDSRAVSRVELHPASPFGGPETPDGVVLTTSFGGGATVEGFGFPVRYRVEVADDPGFDDATTVYEAGGDVENPGEETVGHDADVEGRYVRVTATDPFVFDPREQVGAEKFTQTVEPWACFALAGLSVRGDGGQDLARGRPVTASSSVEEGAWGTAKLVDGTRRSEMAATSPRLRTEFDLAKPVAEARAHLAAVGYGELHVNGERVSDGVLDPAWTRYRDRVLYATTDVTGHVSEGENAIGVWLGRGWFSKAAHLWTASGSPRARLHLTVEYEDGTTRTVATDTTWEAGDSPVVENDVYDGETYDARREEEGWAEPGFDGDWDEATRVESPGGSLRPQRVESMAVVETFDPVEVRDREDGTVFDFGQNLTGWVEVDVAGAERGDEVTVRHAEALTDEGALSTVDLRSAEATDTYVSGGGDDTYEPRFTYHGFRYAQVEGIDVDGGDVTAKAVHTAMDRRGRFDCSNEDLAQVQHNAVWGLRGNTHSIPEDCPQRDERLGWTGDAQISARALLFNYDAARFHEKWMRDHDDAQSDLGYVSDVIPNQVEEIPADPTWSVTRVVIPWYLYRHDGDRAVLERHYESMREYVDYWHGVTEDGVLPSEYGKYGDWLAFENTDGRRGLPHDLFNTAFHHQVLDTFAKVADALGNESDAETYRRRADDVREAFHAEFYDAEAGVYGPGTQSSFAVPLFLGLVPDAEVDRVVENLVEKVEADGGTLRSGFLGTRPLIHALADHGHPELAYRVVSQPERPGWVYMARNGATTMWERWDSDEQVGSGMNSLNHSPFTFVSEWFYEVLAGVRIGDRPVTDHVTLAPATVSDLDRASGSVETPNGRVTVAWERTATGLEVDADVPWNGAATVRLPASGDATVEESGTVVWNGRGASLPDGVTAVERDAGEVVVEVTAGEYAFTVRE